MSGKRDSHFTHILPSQPMNSFYLDSTHFELVIVSGADAERFLQGQLTCDVSALAAGSFTHGAVCNNKGRVITPFILLRVDTNFHIVFTAGLGTLFMATLKKYLPFYKCSMHLDMSDHACLGLAGTQGTNLLQDRVAYSLSPGTVATFDNGWVATLDGQAPLLLVCLNNNDPNNNVLPNQLASHIPQDKGSLWQAANMLLGHFPFSAEDSEKYTPQELNYDRNDYVSFTKGCYTGQEIVARMHYRGKVKKQFFLVKIAVPATQELPSLQLLEQDGTGLASCIKMVRADAETVYALAVLPSDFGESKRLLKTNLEHMAEIQSF